MDDLPFRVVVHAGRTWTVREMEVGCHAWAHGDRCLICEDGTVVRRFWIYPEDWRSMGADELAWFCQTARPSTAATDEPRLSDTP